LHNIRRFMCKQQASEQASRDITQIQYGFETFLLFGTQTSSSNWHNEAAAAQRNPITLSISNNLTTFKALKREFSRGNRPSQLQLFGDPLICC